MISNSEVSFLVETLLIESVLEDPKSYKKAGFVSDLLTMAKQYFDAHIDKSNPVKSIVDILAPGAVSAIFSALGFGKFGFLLGLLMDVFHVDVYGMFRSLASKIHTIVASGEKISSSQVDDAVSSTTQEFSKPASEIEAREGYEALKEKQTQPESSWANDGKVYSSLELLDDVNMFRLALVDYEHQKMRLLKEAIGIGSFLTGYGPTKAKGTSLLAKIFGWIIKIALASAGLLVAGDVVNKVLGRPNALEGTYQAGKEEPETPATPMSTQTKFKLKSDAALPPTWPLVNSPANISNMLVQFAKDVYDGLEGKENIIQSSPAFQAVKDEIDWYNIHNPGSAVIFIPGNFTTKKHLVDFFIDDVAKRTP